MHKEVLVLTATAEEANAAPADTSVFVVGIGKAAAAAATARLLTLRNPARTVVINIGTAGALGATVMGIVRPSRVLNHELPTPLLRQLGYEVPEVLTLVGGDGSTLATGDAFISDSALRAHLAARADIVDMEGYAIAWACLQAGVPLHVVKFVSDSANEEAPSDWSSQVQVGAQALGTWLTRHLPVLTSA